MDPLPGRVRDRLEMAAGLRNALAGWRDPGISAAIQSAGKALVELLEDGGSGRISPYRHHAIPGRQSGWNLPVELRALPYQSGTVRGRRDESRCGIVPRGWDQLRDVPWTVVAARRREARGRSLRKD